jgi:hypothetical protein
MTGVPSASIAIVRANEIVYERACGDGRIDPKMPASPSMRYAIGSVSKQFTAIAVLLLAQDGKLSLNDKVAKWFPQLTRAPRDTIRDALPDDLSHSKGFLERCADASARGTVWIALGVAFFVLGVTSSSGAYIGLGAAFLAIGVSRAARWRRHRSSE